MIMEDTFIAEQEKNIREIELKIDSTRNIIRTKGDKINRFGLTLFTSGLVLFFLIISFKASEGSVSDPIIVKYIDSKIHIWLPILALTIFPGLILIMVANFGYSGIFNKEIQDLEQQKSYIYSNIALRKTKKVTKIDSFELKNPSSDLIALKTEIIHLEKKILTAKEKKKSLKAQHANISTKNSYGIFFFAILFFFFYIIFGKYILSEFLYKGLRFFALTISIGLFMFLGMDSQMGDDRKTFKNKKALENLRNITQAKEEYNSLHKTWEEKMKELNNQYEAAFRKILVKATDKNSADALNFVLQDFSFCDIYIGDKYTSQIWKNNIM